MTEPVLNEKDVTLDRGLFRYVIRTTGKHQIVIALLTIGVFLLEVVPLELQRRVVNDLVKHREYHDIVVLCGVFCASVLLQGGTKLALNIYRGWVGESSTRDLRRRVRVLVTSSSEASSGSNAQGVQASMVVSEVEPIGGFVGGSISEPLLEIGIMASVLAYMVHVDYRMGLSALALFVPQLIFVPLMQRAMNRRTKQRVKVIRRLSISVVETTPGDEEEARTDDERIDRVFRLNVGILSIKFSMNFLMNLSTQLQIIAALLVGGWAVYQQNLEVGGIVAFISGIGKMTDPWGDLVNYFRDVNLNQVKYRLMRDAVNAQAQGLGPGETSSEEAATERSIACLEGEAVPAPADKLPSQEEPR
ncbi:MAG TPA: ABC transporter transmembrane domain-containing protein [Aliidongia sp.]|uniref:ABC transporter transmembrane domain-containing protein n=1 Tax=Aliidongia sp. TaxID=1914230 RepID=UPI002DDD1520|nr:ABC transporter transmembrane domain-containing protein [Aliidongia sp.]HEV2676142.1 ABC transporter transmembrane domain-containing protein [Aliidongia sp.]